MPEAGLYRRIEMADGHVRYEPVADEIDRLRAALRKIRTKADAGHVTENNLNQIGHIADEALAGVGHEQSMREKP